MARSRQMWTVGVQRTAAGVLLLAAGVGLARGDAASTPQRDEASASATAHVVPAAAAAAADPNELKLRQDLLHATWPADMVRLADEYLRLHADQPWAADANHIRQRAQRTAGLLRRDDVHLFRSAFLLPSENGPAVEDLRPAALGDAQAALRLAHRARDTEGGARQQVGWLQLAALLGSDRAAYELALHYRSQSQPLLASTYETRAIELGHVPAPVLDHSRK